MNCRLNQSSAGGLPEVKGSNPQHLLMRILHLTMAVMTGLVVFGTPGLLNAADTAVTNAAVVWSSTNVPSSASTNSFNVLDDKYRLVIGDQLSFQIIEDEDDPVHLVVT